MKKFITSISFILLSIQSFATDFVTIGTGSVTGTYYPTGIAICKFVNKYIKETKIRCTVESTAGSEYNINTIDHSELDFGISQSDVAYNMYNGLKKYKEKPVKELRSVIAIYPELFTLVTRKSSGIKDIRDIKGKKINIGNPGSGSASTASILFSYLNISKKDLAFAGILKAGESPEALRANKIDGYFYMVGHPTANIKDASNSVDISIIPVAGTVIENMIKEHPYFVQADIPANIYKGVEESIPTFGVKALLVTSADVPNKTVYTVVKAILENFDNFKEAHPAHKNITKNSLIKGLSIPLHEGAEKYFKEIGLIE